jgi:hypothetical protein
MIRTADDKKNAEASADPQIGGKFVPGTQAASVHGAGLGATC